jgi:hypothetical protein
VSRRWWLGVAFLAAAVLVAAPAPADSGVDRLERFRRLTATRLGASQLLDGDDVHAEIYALLDEEIVESLSSGSVFASLAFLQDRLDGLADAWGGASLRLARVGPLTVGAFHLADAPGGNSVRVYGTAHGESQLLGTLHRAGRPWVHALPAGPGGVAQFLVAWEGALSGRGTRALRVDLVRQRGEDVSVAWSTADVFPDGLLVREWRVRPGEVHVRYELHYPGWVPGCDAQTEQEDVYRLTRDGAGMARVSRRLHQPWHQALRRSVAAFFTALAANDRGALTSLVPDERLRQRLPGTLRPEPACDAPDGGGPATVSVAAVTEAGAPWALTWEQAGGRWRLRGAAPVLQ